MLDSLPTYDCCSVGADTQVIPVTERAGFHTRICEFFLGSAPLTLTSDPKCTLKFTPQTPLNPPWRQLKESKNQRL